MFGEPTTLIVVYKDEFLVNLFKKLIESNDDVDDEHVVGVKDGSVRVVSWEEKVWLDQKKAGNINNKVLFLGKVKGWNELLPVLDVKYNAFGIKYGWAGNQAALICDVDALEDKKDYNAFLEELNKYNVPEVIKSEKVEISEEEPKEEKSGLLSKIGGFIKKSTKTIVNSLSPEQKKKIKQQYYFGIMKLYENHLEEYLDN